MITTKIITKIVTAPKIQKYQNLEGEIKNIWKLKDVSIQPLIISAKGVLSKRFKKEIENLLKKLFYYRLARL
jgi:hypothetical protein